MATMRIMITITSIMTMYNDNGNDITYDNNNVNNSKIIITQIMIAIMAIILTITLLYNNKKY